MTASLPEPRYLSLGRYLRKLFGEKVHKVSVDAGFTCPNRDGTISTGGCIYCDPASFTPACSGTVTEQLEAGITRVRDRTGARKFIAYFQPHTNTHAQARKLEPLYREALAVDGVMGLAIGTRPDCVPPDVLDLIEELARDTHLWIEYGLQSARDETLRLIRRGHGFDAYFDAVSRTLGRGILICTHLILGLPGESREDMLKTARLVADLGTDGVKLHHLHVVRGTPLEEMYSRGEVETLSFDGYAGLVADVLELFPPEVVIQRLFGWAPADMLVAPDWGMSRPQIQAALDRFFDERGVMQGRRWRLDGGTGGRGEDASPSS